MADRVRLQEVIFEIHRRGNLVRISAIDPVSKHEVVMVGAASVGEKHLKRVAKRKLEYVLTKRLSEQARNHS